VILLHSFSSHFGQRLANIAIPEESRHSLYEQRVKLAGLELPGNLDADTRKQLQQAVAESFISGYRLIMFIAACLAVASAASAGLIIGKKKER